MLIGLIILLVIIVIVVIIIIAITKKKKGNNNPPPNTSSTPPPTTSPIISRHSMIKLLNNGAIFNYSGNPTFVATTTDFIFPPGALPRDDKLILPNGYPCVLTSNMPSASKNISTTYTNLFGITEILYFKEVNIPYVGCYPTSSIGFFISPKNVLPESNTLPDGTLVPAGAELVLRNTPSLSDDPNIPAYIYNDLYYWISSYNITPSSTYAVNAVPTIFPGYFACPQGFSIQSSNGTPIGTAVLVSNYKVPEDSDIPSYVLPNSTEYWIRNAFPLNSYITTQQDYYIMSLTTTYTPNPPSPAPPGPPVFISIYRDPQYDPVEGQYIIQNVKYYFRSGITTPTGTTPVPGDTANPSKLLCAAGVLPQSNYLNVTGEQIPAGAVGYISYNYDAAIDPPYPHYVINSVYYWWRGYAA
jgi:hypothetical protein